MQKDNAPGLTWTTDSLHKPHESKERLCLRSAIDGQTFSLVVV